MGCHGVAEPVGRRDPHEREDGDYPEIVGNRGALIGPEERPIEHAAKALVCRHRFLVEHEVGEIDAIGHGQHGQGENHPQARLTEPLVLAMRERRREGAYFREIAEEFGIPKLTVYDAVTGKTWSHV